MSLNCMPAEMSPAADPAALEKRLVALERHEKPAYADVPEAEKQLRRRREDVIARIVANSPAPRHRFGTDKPRRALA